MIAQQPKHRLQDVKGRPHVAMKRVGKIVFAARVDEIGVWVMAQGVWENDLRRAQRLCDNCA